MDYSKYLSVEVVVTPDNDAYTANDCVGGLQTIGLSAAGANVNGGILNGIRLVDDDDEGAALVLWVFDAAPTTIADDAALALSAADLKKLAYRLSIAATDYVDNNSLKWYGKEDINQVIQTDDKGNWYFYVQCTGTPTYAATKTLTFTFDILSEQ